MQYIMSGFGVIQKKRYEKHKLHPCQYAGRPKRADPKKINTSPRILFSPRPRTQAPKRQQMAHVTFSQVNDYLQVHFFRFLRSYVLKGEWTCAAISQQGYAYHSNFYVQAHVQYKDTPRHSVFVPLSPSPIPLTHRVSFPLVSLSAR